MKSPRWYIPRRTLLQTAGTAIALPALEAMVKPGARAAAPPPRRFLAVHGLVYGYVGRSDAEQKTTIAPWSPRARGAVLPIENNTYMKPFFDRRIESKITLLTGLTDRVLIGTHDSPVKLVAGTYPVAMRRGSCVVLTATPGPTNTVGPPPQPDPFNGATTDQIAASHLGKFTPVPYLSLGLISIGGNPKFTMSNKSANEPVPSDRDPKTVFNRLFSGYDPSASLEDVQRRARYRKSVLDGVREDAGRLRARLGRSDRQKLDGYLENVSSLERVIAKAGSALPAGVTAPGAASSYANRELVQRAMQDLIVQAFITDRTRVVAFSCQYPGSWLRFRGPGQEGLDYSQYRRFSGAPLTGDHHSMSHYDQGLNGSAPSAEITAMKKDWMEIFAHWALEMYADLLGKLDSHMDSDGASTVLDNVVSVWGGDNADSARHAFLSMPCVLGGRGGATTSGWRIKSGRHIRFADYGAGTKSERSWKDLLWGMLNIVGVPDPDGSPRLKSFGYATNPLDLDLR
jgi:hypothetical protein